LTNAFTPLVSPSLRFHSGWARLKHHRCCLLILFVHRVRSVLSPCPRSVGSLRPNFQHAVPVFFNPFDCRLDGKFVERIRLLRNPGRLILCAVATFRRLLSFSLCCTSLPRRRRRSKPGPMFPTVLIIQSSRLVHAPERTLRIGIRDFFFFVLHCVSRLLSVRVVFVSMLSSPSCPSLFAFPPRRPLRSSVRAFLCFSRET